jgi:hypothetical protein
MIVVINSGLFIWWHISAPYLSDNYVDLSDLFVDLSDNCQMIMSICQIFFLTCHLFAFLKN